MESKKYVAYYRVSTEDQETTKKVLSAEEYLKSNLDRNKAARFQKPYGIMIEFDEVVKIMEGFRQSKLNEVTDDEINKFLNSNKAKDLPYTIDRTSFINGWNALLEHLKKN